MHGSDGKPCGGMACRHEAKAGGVEVGVHSIGRVHRSVVNGALERSADVLSQ